MNKYTKSIRIMTSMSFMFIVLQTPLNAELTDTQAEGKIEYINNCAVCHGKEGKGDGPFINQLTKLPSNLSLLSKNNGGSFPETVIYQLIDGRRIGISDEGRKVEPFHGPRDMPIWGDEFRTVEGDEGAVDERISNLLEYIKVLQVE